MREEHASIRRHRKEECGEEAVDHRERGGKRSETAEDEPVGGEGAEPGIGGTGFELLPSFCPPPKRIKKESND